MLSPTWGNSAYTSDSGSYDLTLLASAVGVTDRAWLSLRYELHDVGLQHLAWSLACCLARAVVLLAPLALTGISGVQLGPVGPCAQIRARRRPGVRGRRFAASRLFMGW
jgi:hypothetical protein